MCYPKPGPRCSNHASKALTRATESFYDNREKLYDAQSKLPHRNQPRNEATEARADIARRRLVESRKQYLKARDAYDTTNAGLADLGKKLSKVNSMPSSSMERKKVVARINKGIKNHIHAVRALRGEDSTRDQKMEQKLRKIVEDNARIR